MDIKQILRDAIDNKVAEILKEEYGIELSKEFADKLPKDDQDCENYQSGTNLQNKKSTTLRNEEVSYNADVINR